MSNPTHYAKFGLPGHEGIDIRSPNGEPLYASTDGVVSEVGWRKPKHAYGYAFRISFRLDGWPYELIYAHGIDGSANFKKGDKVNQGNVIMLSDNTGNSSGAHLHLSFKKSLVSGKRNNPPSWANPMDYVILSNGEVLLNPEPWLLSYEESQQILNPKEMQRDLRKVQFY